MLCDVAGCKEVAVHELNGVRSTRAAYTIHLCDKHMPNVEQPNAELGTVVIERPASERIELPVNHPRAKDGAVVNTTNVSGTTGLTGDTEEAKEARQEISDEAAGEGAPSRIKADTKAKEPQKA